MPTRYRIVILALCLSTVLPCTANCGGFDGSDPITGTVDKLVEINEQRIVGEVDPDTVGLPTSFIIDFDTKTMRGTADSLIRRMVRIKRIEHLGNVLILLGADEGSGPHQGQMGWSLAIEKTSGKAVLSAAGNGIAYVAFGRCQPLVSNP